MKKCVLSLMALVFCLFTFAQNDYKKAPGIGVHLVLNDFKTASTLRSSGLATVIRTKQWSKVKNMNAGLALSYTQGLSQHVDANISLAGSFLDYPVPNTISDIKERLLLEAAGMVHLKLLSDRYFFNPFINAGVGASKWKGYYAAFIPVGVGFQVKILDQTFLLLNSQYRIPVTANGAYHLYHSVGIISGFMKKKEVVPVEVVPPPVVVLDRDNDGVLDTDDKCPDVAGLASLQGCPDKDGDGIADGDDKCPDFAGIAKYQGCPIPDTDADGIDDEADKCPTVKGFARYQGCPIPDSDGDGVNDEEDKCADRPGPASNMGCPVIAKEIIDKVNFAAKNVFFATGSAKLLPKSFKSLNEVASILAADPSLMIDIDGHTVTWVQMKRTRRFQKAVQLR
jgi:OOP family OmpA-OmpF porin